MLAMITITIAQKPSPTHDGPRSASPAWTSDQLITLKVGSKIHIQAIVESTVGTIQGSNSAARTKFLKGKRWFITSASPIPPISLKTVAANVKTNVFWATCQNTGELQFST